MKNILTNNQINSMFGKISNFFSILEQVLSFLHEHLQQVFSHYFQFKGFLSIFQIFLNRCSQYLSIVCKHKQHIPFWITVRDAYLFNSFLFM